MNEWLDPKDWFRSGRGRSWTFGLPSAEIIDAIREVAVNRRDRIDLISSVNRRRGQAYVSEYLVIPLAALGTSGDWNYFLRSASLTPTLPECVPLPAGSWPQAFAANGLINLQHPAPSKHLSDNSSLGVVHRLRNVRTGEERVHDGYDRLFTELKRRLQATN